MSNTYLTINRNSNQPTVILVEHAGNLIPDELAGLGLDASARTIDPQMYFDGYARHMAEAIANDLGLTAIFGINSRLVVDLNREADHPNVITETAHGRTIPGNQGLDARGKAERLKLYYEPFHADVGAILTQRQEAGESFNLVSIHSFSPAEAVRAFPDQPLKPVDIAALYDEECELSAFFRNTVQPGSYAYQENYPYDLRQLKTGSILACKRSFGCDAIGLELNVETLAREGGFRDLKEILAGVLSPLQELSPQRQNPQSAKGVQHGTFKPE